MVSPLVALDKTAVCSRLVRLLYIYISSSILSEYAYDFVS